MARRRRNEPEGPPPVLTVTDPATGAVVTTEQLEPEPPRPPVTIRRRWVVLALALLAAAVAAGVWLRVGTSAPDPAAMPAAVTEQPAEAWTHDLDGQGSVAAAGDHVVVSGEGGLTGLDRDGDVAWTVDEHRSTYLLPTGADDVVVVVGDGIGAVSAEDGAELWWRDGGDIDGLDGEAVLVRDGDTLSRVDARSGEEVWSVEGTESSVLGEEALYVVTDDELRRLDPESGRVEWAVEEALGGLPVAVNEDLVVVTGGFAVTAYDAADGAEAWTVDGSRGTGGGLTVGVWSDERVYLATTTYVDDGDSSGGEVEVRDRDGSVGTIEVAPDDDVYGQGVSAGGRDWFVDIGSGGLYDDRLERVADYDGQVVAADDGVYALGEELAYYPYGDSGPAWELAVPHGDDAYLTAADDLLLVTDDGTLTAYR